MFDRLLALAWSVMTCGSPLFWVALLAVLSHQRDRLEQSPIRTLALLVAMAALFFGPVLLGMVSWYIEPGYASSPEPAVALMLVLITPSLIVSAGAFFIARKLNWSLTGAVAFAVVVGYIVMASSLFPAAIVFVNLGGDTL